MRSLTMGVATCLPDAIRGGELSKECRRVAEERPLLPALGGARPVHGVRGVRDSGLPWELARVKKVGGVVWIRAVG